MWLLFKCFIFYHPPKKINEKKPMQHLCEVEGREENKESYENWMRSLYSNITLFFFSWGYSCCLFTIWNESTDLTFPLWMSFVSNQVDLSWLPWIKYCQSIWNKLWKGIRCCETVPFFNITRRKKANHR